MLLYYICLRILAKKIEAEQGVSRAWIRASFSARLSQKFIILCLLILCVINIMFINIIIIIDIICINSMFVNLIVYYYVYSAETHGDLRFIKGGAVETVFSDVYDDIY